MNTNLVLLYVCNLVRYLPCVRWCDWYYDQGSSLTYYAVLY